MLIKDRSRGQKNEKGLKLIDNLDLCSKHHVGLFMNLTQLKSRVKKGESETLEFKNSTAA